MPDPNEATGSPGDPLDAVIAEYVQHVEAGEIPDREALLARHPELAERLRAFFADYDRLDRQAAELRLSADPNRTTDAPGPVMEFQRVRYFGDYELLEVIAHGGMGVVYKARQMSLNRVVALKMILHGELTTERDVARFRAEAEAAANLDHPHIVPIYEVGEHDGLQYYSMRYVEGTSLARRPRTDSRSEARLLAAVAGAVHHAHRRGVLHRDLKPSNILVDTAGVPLVADFGLAKRVDADRSLTQSGVIVGTPRYMAPEQAAGRKDLTVAVDVYSLGVVLYERLTGHTPFAGETVLELLRQAREEEPPRPSSVCPGLDRDLETICLKCLEKDPLKRYGSAEALQDDLERWLRCEPILARPVGQAERFWRWCRRNPVVAGLSAGLIAALLTGTAVSLAFAVRAEAERSYAEERAGAESRERQRAEKAESIAVAAKDDLELALARGMVRPLQPNGNRGLSGIEIDALWQLAEKRGERLWLLFLVEAMRTPLTTSQLSGRAESAWIAAVGLDPEKRKLVEDLLVQRLEAADLSENQRLDLARAALTLGDLDAVFSKQMLDILIEGLASKDKSIGHNKDADLLIEFTQRLEPGTATGILTQMLEKETNGSNRYSLTRELATAAGRMEPDEATHILTQALEKEKEKHAWHRSFLFQGLAEVAERIEPSKAARILIQALEKETDGWGCLELSGGLANVTRRIEPAEATRILGQAASLLIQALEKDTNSYHRDVLAQGLAKVAEKMEPIEAVRVSRQAVNIFTQAIEKETNAWGLNALAVALAAVAARIDSREAKRLSGQAANILTRELEKETNAEARQNLARGLAAVAGRMELPTAARILTQALEKEKDGIACFELAGNLANLAGRMEPSEAARVRKQAASILTSALEKIRSRDPRNPLAEDPAEHRFWFTDALVYVAGRMEPDKAARVLTQALQKERDWKFREKLARGLAETAGKIESPSAVQLLRQAANVLTTALEKETEADARLELADSLAAVTGRMEPDKAARILTQALEKESHAKVRNALVRELSSVSRRMSEAEADSVCQPVMQRLLQAVETEKDESERYILAMAVASLLSASDNVDASRVLAKLVFAGCSDGRINAQGFIGRRMRFIQVDEDGIDRPLDALLTNDSRSEVSRRTIAVGTAYGLIRTMPIAALSALPAASEPLPCRLSTQDLVELLKMPTCYGEARKVVLKHLGNRYGRVFANHWEFVRFAQEQHLDLDLTSPPKRWRRP
jgi:tRNA A-37 threonylcarbamoyl transferase component Bud32